MLYEQSKATNNNISQKQRINKIHQSISPIYKYYFSNIPKNTNNKNINSFLLNESNHNNNFSNYSVSNSVSKTTKNSPRNFKNYNRNKNNNNKMNNNINESPKFDTSINSPKNCFPKKMNFKAAKLNLNVKTLNMNLKIKKFNNFTNDNSKDYNDNNLSILNNKDAFIEAENKRNEFSKIKLNDLRNQLSEIITPGHKNEDINKNFSNSKIKNKGKMALEHYRSHL